MTATEIIQELVFIRGTVKPLVDQIVTSRFSGITRSYDFITLDWNNEDDNLFARLEFTCVADIAELKLLYCEDRPLEDSIRKIIPTSLPVAKATFPFAASIGQYLQTADRIAALTVNKASGDGYRPGNYSKVLLAEDQILLSQINHMNAKSLAHKENYSLRDLEFLIPLLATPTIKFHHDYQSGAMGIRFDDRSSKNNRQHGDRVKEELERLNGEM